MLFRSAKKADRKVGFFIACWVYRLVQMPRLTGKKTRQSLSGHVGFFCVPARRHPLAARVAYCNCCCRRASMDWLTLAGSGWPDLSSTTTWLLLSFTAFTRT